MTTNDLISLRLHNQHILGTKYPSADQVVKWCGAVQAQEYPHALWSLSQRMTNAHEFFIEKECNRGAILRTHVMRPTWHFVHPHDIRWLLKLTAPRVKTLMSYYNKKLSLTEEVFKKSNSVIAKALKGKKELTRLELSQVLERAHIKAKGQMLGHLVMQAELDGIICSGAKRGKQFTYVLLEEKVPPTKTLDRDEALSELAKRYFQSHGPATISDFSWWSGLTMKDAKKGLEMNRNLFINEQIEGRMYWFSPYKKIVSLDSPAAYLMSIYDEYIIGYKNRDILSNPLNKILRGNALWNLVFIIDGKICGKWKRILKNDSVTVEIKPFKTLNTSEKNAVQKAKENYAKFLNRSLT